jgi:LPXTG-site transpeptidase (sortase) family protein
MARRRYITFVLVRTIANTLIMLGIIFTFLTFWPLVGMEFRFYWDKLRGQQYVISEESGDETNVGRGFGNLLSQPRPISIVPVSRDFGLVVEKINVNAPVVKNVDSANYTEYMQALRSGAAHAKGTALPGSKENQNNNVFIFAHSTLNFWQMGPYATLFTLLNKLEKGDRVVTFYQGQRYDYLVTEKKIVEATDTKYLTEPSSEPILTLQTCDPPGTNFRRLIVTAKLAN